jgi:hypothetical protein
MASSAATGISHADAVAITVPMPTAPVLLLTATVDPGACVFTARADPATRLADYRLALGRWIAARTFTRIVWCESSGWPLTDFDDLRAAAARGGIDLELISYQGQDFDMTRGKGYGELGVIGHALAHAPSLAGEEVAIVKVTGRYFVANAAPLLALLADPDPPGLVCDLRENLTVADSRIFSASRHIMSTYLTPLRSLANDSQQVFFEHLLARAAHAAMGAGLTWALMPMVPRILGVSATRGQHHGYALSKRLRYRLKRRLFRY